MYYFHIIHHNIFISFFNFLLFSEYMAYEQHYFGGTIGRVSDFITEAEFHLNKEDSFLTANEGKYHYHGGFVGFDKVIKNIILPIIFNVKGKK